MAELSESTRHAAVCGEIIQILGREYPRPVSVKTIVNAMYGGDMLTTRDISRQVGYLADAGYLRLIGKYHDNLSNMGLLPEQALAKLTAQGVKLSNRLIADDGVTL
jgi:hypothetical protein